MISVKFEYIEYSLRIALIIFACNCGLSEQFAPLFGHALYAIRNAANQDEKTTYSEGARDGIKPDMHFVYEIGRIAHAAERTSRVDIVLPAVQFFVSLHREIVALISRFKEQAVWFQVRALDICQVTELNGALRRCRLVKE
jgi:hypothetical protein